ncbi:hypothetical protein CDAR_420791 [Caerostris darwini]|nr:hypothetical protein CDAR_420791 [Caerostris darwini]
MENIHLAPLENYYSTCNNPKSNVFNVVSIEMKSELRQKKDLLRESKNQKKITNQSFSRPNTFKRKSSDISNKNILNNSSNNQWKRNGKRKTLINRRKKCCPKEILTEHKGIKDFAILKSKAASSPINKIINSDIQSVVQTPEKMLQTQKGLNCNKLKNSKQISANFKRNAESSSQKPSTVFLPEEHSGKTTNVKQRRGGKKRRCNPKSNLLQNSKNKDDELWKVKNRTNATCDKDDKLVPALILQRPSRIVATKSSSPTNASEKTIVGKRGKTFFLKDQFSPTFQSHQFTNTVIENKVGCSKCRSLIFTPPIMNDVRRVFRVQTPRCRSAPPFRNNNEIKFQSHVSNKMSNEIKNFDVPPHHQIYRLKAFDVNASMIKHSMFDASSSPNISNLKSENWDFDTETVYSNNECTGYNTETSCIEDTSGCDGQAKIKLKKPNVVVQSRVSAERKSKTKARLLLKEILPKRRVKISNQV